MKICFRAGLFVFPAPKHTPQIARSAKIRTEPKQKKKNNKNRNEEKFKNITETATERGENAIRIPLDMEMQRWIRRSNSIKIHRSTDP